MSLIQNSKKGIGAGITFFALWVLMVPNSTMVEVDQKTSSYYVNLSIHGVYEVGLKYFIVKETCETVINQARYFSKNSIHVPYPLFKDSSNAQLGNGLCVKASEL